MEDILGDFAKWGFISGDEVYARTVAVGKCGSTNLRSDAAYDRTPVTLRGGATVIPEPSIKSKTDVDIEVCW